MGTLTYNPPVLPLTGAAGNLAQVFRKRHLGLLNEIALIEDQRQLTFADFWRDADRNAATLTRKGVRKGHIIAIVCPMSSIEVVEWLMAAIQLGAAPIILNLADKFQKLQPADAGAYGFIVSKDIQKFINPANLEQYAAADLLSDHLVWHQLTGSDQAQTTEAALLVTSSGSTNHKKIIKYGAEGLLFNIKSNIAALGIRREDRTLMVLPLTYSYGLVGQFMSHFLMGSTVVFSNKWLITNTIIELISRHRINSVFTVPPIFRQMVFLLEKFDFLYRRRYSWSSLRYITVGGNHIESSNILKALSIYRCPIVKTFGLAEAGPRVATNIITSADDPIDAVGYPLNGVHVYALGEDGRPVADGDCGKLVIETPSASLGYLRRHHNGLTIDGRTIHTQDLGTVNRDGLIRIFGRADGQLLLPGCEPIWQNELADLIYANFYVLKLKIEHPEQGQLNIEIAPMPNCKIKGEDVLARIGAQFGEGILSRVRIAFPKISQIKLDK